MEAYLAHGASMAKVHDETASLVNSGSLPHKGLIKASEGAWQPALVAWLGRPGFPIYLSVLAIKVLQLCVDGVDLL